MAYRGHLIFHFQEDGIIIRPIVCENNRPSVKSCTVYFTFSESFVEHSECLPFGTFNLV